VNLKAELTNYINQTEEEIFTKLNQTEEIFTLIKTTMNVIQNNIHYKAFADEGEKMLYQLLIKIRLLVFMKIHKEM